MSATAAELAIVRNLQQAEAAEDLNLTQPREDANPPAEPIKEDKPMFKKPRKPKAPKEAAGTAGTKAKKQTGAGAKTAAAGKKQRASVKAAAAKPVPKKPKQTKKNKKTEEAEPKKTKKPRKAGGASSAGGADALVATGAPTAAAANPEGAKLDMITDLLLEMANARLRAGQAATATDSAAAVTSHSISTAPAAEVRAAHLPHLEGHVTGL